MGRWTPLFKLSRTTAVVPVALEGPPGAAAEGQRARPANGTPLKGLSGSSLPHAWGPGALLLDGSGRPLQTGPAEVAEEEQLSLPGMPQGKRAAAAPRRGILAAGGPKKAKRAGKPRFIDGLVTDWLEPALLSDLSDPNMTHQRAAKRKVTGFSFGHAQAEHVEQEGSKEQLGEEPVKSFQESEGSGFGSDDEFEDLEKLAAKNSQANQIATKLATPVTLSVRSKLAIPGAYSSALPKVIASQQLQAEAPLKQERPGSRNNSGFASSDGEDDGPPRPRPAAGAQCRPQGSQPGQTTAPAAAPKTARRADSDNSSFAAGSDEDNEPPLPRAPAGAQCGPQGSQLGPITAPAPRTAKRADSDNSSFAASDEDDEDDGEPYPPRAAAGVPCGPQGSQPVPATAPAAPKTAKRADSDNSSFASSSDGEDYGPPPPRPAARAQCGPQGSQPGPSAPKTAKQADSQNSSFAASDDDDDEPPQPRTAVGAQCGPQGSQPGPITALAAAPKKAKRADSENSSFASSDEEDPELPKQQLPASSVAPSSSAAAALLGGPQRGAPAATGQWPRSENASLSHSSDGTGAAGTPPGIAGPLEAAFEIQGSPRSSFASSDGEPG